MTTTATTTATKENSDNKEEQEELAVLKRENKVLQERLKLLEVQNDALSKKQHQSNIQQQQYEQRLILEDFEGETIPTVDARGGAVDGWNKNERRYTEHWDEQEQQSDGTTDGSGYPEFNMDGRQEVNNEFSLSGKTTGEDDVCEYDDTNDKWYNAGGECPMEPNITFLDAMKSRAGWLVGLLAMQSCSGFILARNEALLQNHPVIIYFLTMLVGAGGNAGNQASVRVIRGLALGTLNPATQSQFLSREFRMAVVLSVILSLAGFARAMLFQTPFPETMAVTVA